MTLIPGRVLRTIVIVNECNPSWTRIEIVFRSSHAFAWALGMFDTTRCRYYLGT